MLADDTVTLDDRTIAFARAGSGPPVVFCHGTPFSSVVWSRYADALSADFTVHVWDMPGYGRSSKDPAHAVDIGAQARTFAALLAHWGLDGTTPDTVPHVVAHDIGGAVSLRATLDEGARYASLLLVDTVAIPPAGSPFFRFVQANPTTLDALPAYIHDAILRAYVGNASHRGLAADDLEALLEPWRGPEGQPAFYRQIAQFDGAYLERIEAGLDRLDVPVHVAWGEDDGWLPLSTGERLAGLLPGAGLTTIAGAGHLVQYDAPVALTDLLRRWLDTRR